MSKIKKCPFCGSEEAPVVLSTEDMYADIIDLDETGLGLSYTVCCDVMSGGCGATGGYWATKKEAISAWNRRNKDD